MTKIAVIGKALIDLILVAGRALDVTVGAGEFESGLIVLKGGGQPCILGMAVATFGAHFSEVNVSFFVTRYTE